MIRPALLAVALATGLLPLDSAAALAAPAGGPVRAEPRGDVAPEDALEDLVRWLERARRRGRFRPDAEDVGELRDVLRRIDAGPSRRGDWGPALWRPLLDLAGLAVDPERDLDEDVLAEVGRLAREALSDQLRFESRRAPLLAWVRDEVLAGRPDVPRPRRLAALEMLAGREDPTTRLAVLSLARDPDPRLRWAALEALAGARDDAVHDLFLDALDAVERATEEGGGPFGGATGRRRLDELLERHLADLGAPLEDTAAERLAARTLPELVDEDWRRAAAALRRVPALPSRLAVPALVGALSRWQERGPEGSGSLRIEHALAAELGRRSGRSLGLDPRRWALWWESVQGGSALPAGDGEGERAPTRATFFGLQPRSDRVIFVIDRSTSMSARASYRTERTRYEEAREQLVRYLQAIGPRARFTVATFSDRGRRWRSRLTQATPEAVQSAERWLAGQDPDGGTHLAEGLEEALDLRPGRPLDASRVEADTIVVLCDGATVEDGAWAREWLERHNRDAELVFRCVQIGGASAGSLEALATGSGGTFLRADV